MRKRLVSFCAVLLCGIFSATCLAPAAAAFSNLEHLPIDPWKDLDDVQNRPEILPEVPDLKDEVESVPELKEEFPSLKGEVSNRSLNDDNMSRYIRLTGNLGYGEVQSSRFWVPQGTIIRTYEGAGNYLLASQYIDDPGFNMIATFGYTVVLDWAAPVEYAAEAGGKLLVDGQVFVSVRCLLSNQQFFNGNTSYIAEVSPQYAQLLVNGQPYGDKIDVVNGGFRIPTGTEIPLDEGISEIGFRFTRDLTESGTASALNASAEDLHYRGAYLFINDETVLTIYEEPNEPEYNGLLGAIIGWLQNLWNAITGLGDTIVNGLLDGISGLFVPTEEEITEMKDQYSTLLSERLGFIYQGYEWTISSAEEIVATMQAQEEYSFTFPGISIPYRGQILTIVPQQPVSMENAVMDVLRPVLGTIISLVSVAAFAHTAFDMVTALISGVSYFGFLKGKRGGNGE